MIRSQCYKQDLGIDGILAEADSYDSIADTYIIRKGEKIIGGARTISSFPHLHRSLPLEGEGFSLLKALPRLNLERSCYSEISRLAILPEFRSMPILDYLVRFIFAFLKNQQIDYLFTNSPLVQARTYRKITGAIGYHYSILNELEMPVQKVYSSLQRVVLSGMPFNSHLQIMKDPTSAKADYCIISQPADVKAA